MHGRIFFPGNPWPQGHALESFRWGGAIVPGRGLLMHFELESAKYYADDDEDEEEEDPGDAPDWEIKFSWANYHACSLGPSSTNHYGGILVPRPFVLGQDAYSFTADPLPVDWDTFFDTNAFSIYLLGHDAVADHRLEMRRTGDTYELDWSGRIALYYVGEKDFSYSFQAHAKDVAFDSISLEYLDPARAREHLGVEVDPDLNPRDYLAPYVDDPDRFRFEQRHGIWHAVLKA